MILLILGVALWSLAHYWRRVAPAHRAKMGDTGKGLVAMLVVASLLMMIFGYRMADTIVVWSPPAFLTYVNNALMVLALWIYGSSAAKGAKAWPAYKTRHPQLLGFKVWAFAHLLVNGDLASLILFGGLLAWAVASVILINKAEPHWVAPEPAGRKTYIRLAVITAIMLLVITGIHAWLGVNPFG